MCGNGRRICMVMGAVIAWLGLSLLAGADESINQLSRYEKLTGWALLFDGKSTAGWRNYQKETVSDGWKIEDGALTRSGAKAGDIITQRQFEHFELQLQYKISPKGNSGLMFHVAETEKMPWQTGPEIQIQDNIDGKDPQKAGWLYQLYQPVKPQWAVKFEKQVGITTPDVADATRPPGQWNHLYLRIAKNQCEVIVNGVSYFTFQMGTDEWNKRVAASKFAKFPNFGKVGKGHVCLQDHGDLVAFRNIKVREITPEGTAAEPIDGTLPLDGKLAFPNLKWEGWDAVDASGQVQKQRPIVLTHAGDGSGRTFVATQDGEIYVFPSKGDVDEAKLFLNLKEKVQNWRKADEEGFLGLAFHPQYKQNGYFYVCYTSAAEAHVSVVSRFSVSKTDPNRADQASEQIVMKLPQPFANHNGGSIVFGNDGYLYIGLGDGGGRNDPLLHGQNLGTWMGSLLRIDVDHHDAGKNYAVPKDNPFVKRADAKPEIYAYGFRNIWRLANDRKTGTIWAADVGQDLWEEINIIKAGGNYGWSARESQLQFSNVAPTDPQALVDPIWAYDHRAGKSITGGLVYRGSRLPELQGKYVYGDYVSGKIWALEFDPATHAARRNLGIITGGMPVISFGEDEAGEVYYMIPNANGKGIYRFEKKN